MNSQIVILRDALKSKVPFLLVAAVIPVSLFLKAGFVNVAVIWFFALSLFSYDASEKRSFRSYYLLFLPVLLFILYVIWLLFSQDVKTGLNLVVRKVHLLLIPLAFVISNKKLSEKEFQMILAIFLVGCIGASLVCYINAIVNIIQNRSFVDPSIYKFYYFSYLPLTEPLGITPIYLSMYANLAIVIVYKSPLIHHPLLRTSLAVYIGVFIVLIAAKIGIITLLAILLIFSLMAKTRYRKIISRLFLISLVLLFIIAIYKFPILKEKFVATTSFDYTEQNGAIWNSTTLRLAIWSSAVEAIKKRFLLGYGPGDGQIALEEAYVEKGFIWGLYYQLNPGVPQYNSHNEFFSAMLDVGVLGLLLLILIVVGLLIHSLRSKDILSFSFIVIIFLAFCVESVLFRQKGIVFFTFFYSLICWHNYGEK